MNPHVKSAISTWISRFKKRPVEVAIGTDEIERFNLIKIYVSRTDPYAQNHVIKILKLRFKYFVGYAARGYTGAASEGMLIFELLVADNEKHLVKEAAKEIRNSCRGSVFIGAYGGKSI